MRILKKAAAATKGIAERVLRPRKTAQRTSTAAVANPNSAGSGSPSPNDESCPSEPSSTIESRNKPCDEPAPQEESESRGEAQGSGVPTSDANSQSDRPEVDGDESTFSFEDDENRAKRLPTEEELKKMDLEKRYAAASAWLDATGQKKMNKAMAPFGLKLAQYHTFRRRHKALAKARRQSQEKRQRMTAAQELTLVDWCHYLALMGTPLNRKTLIPRVIDILQLGPGEKMPGRSWYCRFIRRHPELKKGRPSGLDPQRAKCFNYSVIKAHFDEFKREVLDRGIPWCNIYNMDEKGLQLSGGRKQRQEKYLVPKGIRCAYTVRSDNLELVTVIECVCADGSFLKPTFIFSGKSHSAAWYEDWQEIGACAFSDNGWTDDVICLEWFLKVYLPQAREYAQKNNASDDPLVLIIDGHGSHITMEMREAAFKEGVLLYALPPHTTHRCQPLDVGVFSSLQRKWAERCDDLSHQAAICAVGDDTEEGAAGRGMTRDILVSEYIKLREKAFKSETILKAWEKSGLNPFNPDIFTAEDFAPSALSSTLAILPSTFPIPAPMIDEELLDPEVDPAEVAHGQGDVVGVEDNEDNSQRSGGGNASQEMQSTVQPSPPQLSLPPTPANNPPFTPIQQAPAVLLAGPALPSYIPANVYFGPPSSTVPAPATLATSSLTSASLPASITPTSSVTTTPHLPYQLMPPLVTFGIRSSLNSPVSASATAERQRAVIAKLEKATRSELAIRTLRAEEKATELAARVGALEVHARMAAREIGQLKAAQNAKKGRKKKANHFGSDRRLLTGEEGMREARMAEETREAARQAEETKRTSRKETMEQQQADRIRLAPTQEHSGSIRSFKKSELLDVLASLALVANPSDAARLRDEKGTNPQLVERIENYLANHHSVLATAPQFKGLYPGNRSTKRRLDMNPAEQENITMPSTSSSEPATNRRRTALGEHVSYGAPSSSSSGDSGFPPFPATPLSIMTPDPTQQSQLLFEPLPPSSENQSLPYSADYPTASVSFNFPSYPPHDPFT